MTDKKMWRQLRQRLKEAGCTVTLTRNMHYKIRHEGRVISTLAGSASDPRSYRNAIANLRREGVRI